MCICSGIIIYNKIKVAETSASIDNISESNLASANSSDGEKESNTTQIISEEQQNFINEINNIYNGKEGKRAFLTFDDGPTKEVTPHILDILDKYNIKADHKVRSQYKKRLILIKSVINFRFQ